MLFLVHRRLEASREVATFISCIFLRENHFRFKKFVIKLILIFTLALGGTKTYNKKRGKYVIFIFLHDFSKYPCIVLGCVPFQGYL